MDPVCFSRSMGVNASPERLPTMLTGRYTSLVTRKRKNPHAQALSRLAQKARTRALSPERRSEIARKAARARWKRAKETR